MPRKAQRKGTVNHIDTLDIITSHLLQGIIFLQILKSEMFDKCLGSPFLGSIDWSSRASYGVPVVSSLDNKYTYSCKSMKEKALAGYNSQQIPNNNNIKRMLIIIILLT